jgi:cell division protease FtsH
MGPMVFGQRHEMVFLGRDIGEQRNFSEQVAREIDKEVNRIVSEAYDRARQILTKYSDLHHAITRRLIEAETLDAEEFEAFFAGISSVPPRRAEPSPKPDVSAQHTDGQRNTGVTNQGADWPANTPVPFPTPA